MSRKKTCDDYRWKSGMIGNTIRLRIPGSEQEGADIAADECFQQPYLSDSVNVLVLVNLEFNRGQFAHLFFNQ